MPTKLYLPAEVDAHLGWRSGRAQRLARAGKIAHTRLIDGSIRFTVEQIERLARPVPAGSGPLRLVGNVKAK